MLEKRDVRATGPRNEIDFSNKRELVAKENWRSPTRLSNEARHFRCWPILLQKSVEIGRAP
jgi:hypothetical protein